MIVFFYGLFMDDDLLRSMGAHPRRVGVAIVPGLRLRLGARATLVPAPDGTVEGTVTELEDDEVARLYSGPALEGYAPMDVTAVLPDGGRIRATTYTLPDAQASGPPNAEYAAKLRALAARLGLSPEYIATI